MEDKHAYCIMAHHNWHQLQKLVNCLDDVRNDIHLLIDAKSMGDYRRGGVNVYCSKLYLVENSVDIEWSDVSLVDAEVKLFESVLNTNELYRYVHLLSGEDLPLANQEDIHNFFARKTEQFIELDFMPSLRKRLKYYHFFVRGRRNNKVKDTLRRILLLPQWFIIDRLRSAPLKYCHGGEWCSLTMEAIQEIVGSYSKYRYMFTHTTCSDTHYKQMILYSSTQKFIFSDLGSLRYIIFDEPAPSPITLSMMNYDEMMKSGCLFARKFNEHSDVFDVIYNKVCPANHNQ